MEFVTNPLNILTLSPLLGVLVLLFLPSGKKNLLRWTALLTSLLTFGLSIWMLGLFRVGLGRWGRWMGRRVSL